MLPPVFQADTSSSKGVQNSRLSNPLQGLGFKLGFRAILRSRTCAHPQVSVWAKRPAIRNVPVLHVVEVLQGLGCRHQQDVIKPKHMPPQKFLYPCKASRELGCTSPSCYLVVTIFVKVLKSIKTFSRKLWPESPDAPAPPKTKSALKLPNSLVPY